MMFTNKVHHARLIGVPTRTSFPGQKVKDRFCKYSIK